MTVKIKRYAGPSFEEKRHASSGARFLARKYGLTASEAAEVARAPRAIVIENERWADLHGLAPSSAPARGRLLERVREEAARRDAARRAEGRGPRTARRGAAKRAARKVVAGQRRGVEQRWPALGERRRARPARKVVSSGSVSRWEAKTLAAVDQGDLLMPAERDRLPRLEARGFLDERSGRLTAKGRRALASWQEDPDIALLTWHPEAKAARKGGR